MKNSQIEEHKNLKIIFVSNSCWSIYNFRLEVIKHFLQRGFEVHIIATKDDFAIMLMNLGCKIHHIGFNNRELNPFADITFYFELKRLYKRIKPSLIFHYVIKPNIYGSIAASSLKIPSVAVITGLGYAFSKQNWLTVLVTKLYKTALKNVTSVWFLNRDDAELFSSKKIAAPDKIQILRSEGVNTDYFKRSEEKDCSQKKPFVFLMLTRMLWTKGIGVLAESVQALHEKGFSFECHIIGFFERHHPNTVPIEKLQEWQEKKIFNYMGFASNVLPFLNMADCFVLPSYYNEGVPRSLLEACSMQIPVITTDNTGCRDVVINGINGFLCKKNDPVDLANKMQQILLMDEKARCAMGTKGRELVLQKFDVRYVLEKYNGIVNSILCDKVNAATR